MNIKPILVGGLAVAVAGLAAAMALPQADEPDYAALPPEPGAVEQQLRSAATGLIPAITAAERHVGGIAGAAMMRLERTPPVIEVVVYAEGRARLVTVDSGSGAVTDDRDMPRFPGVEVEGEWVETPSGLKYYDIVTGTGAMPASPTAAVTIQFTAWFVTGEVFGTSRDRDEPTTLPLSAAPPGLAEGIGTMRVGGLRKLIIPGALAYGAAGRAGVPPNATMIFDVELVSVADYSAVPDIFPGDPVAGAPIKLPSGLMYYDLVEGTGVQPAGPATVVKVHYTGWLNDGKKFDASYDHPGGEPYQTPLNQVIKGWTEGVGGMRVGGKRKLIIPFELAYGAAGDPRRGMPPGALLIFDVELVEVVSE